MFNNNQPITLAKYGPKKALTIAVLASMLAVSTQTNAANSEDLEAKIKHLELQLEQLKQMVTTQAESQQKTQKMIERQPLLTKGTTFDYGGFIKVDAMWSEYSDTQRAAASVGDDFLVPSQIAVGDGTNGGSAYFDAHAKNSRFWLKTVTDTEAGSVMSYIEMDFNSSGDERITNQASTGLRHAFLKWNYSDTASLLAGQTWSTFFNTGALPEAVDFIGPTSGTIFNRQLQLRWSKQLQGGGSLMFSAENPSSGFNDGGSGVDGSNFDDNTMPDLVARYNGSAGNLSYSAAALVREIAYDNGISDDSETGVALSLSGKYSFENGDDLKFMVNHGNLGRYIALNAFRDGVVEADGDIELIDVTGAFIAYRHLWNDQWRSTFSYAMAEADNPDSAVNDLTETVSNVNVNLLYSPTKKLTLGAEYIFGEREVESGLDGDIKRLQLMGKWAF